MNHNLKYNNQLQLVRDEHDIDCPCKEVTKLNQSN